MANELIIQNTEIRGNHFQDIFSLLYREYDSYAKAYRKTLELFTTEEPVVVDYNGGKDTYQIDPPELKKELSHTRESGSSEASCVSNKPCPENGRKKKGKWKTRKRAKADLAGLKN